MEETGTAPSLLLTFSPPNRREKGIAFVSDVILTNPIWCVLLPLARFAAVPTHYGALFAFRLIELEIGNQVTPPKRQNRAEQKLSAG